MPLQKLLEIRTLSPAFTDHRGEIFNVLQDLEIHHVARYTSKKGAIRGNHYHPRGIEAFFLESGACELFFEDPINLPLEERRTHLIVPQLEIAVYDARLAHAMKFLEDSVAWSFTTVPKKEQDYAKHTIKFSII